MKFTNFFISLIIRNLNNCKHGGSTLIPVYRFIHQFIQVIVNVLH